jgi:Zn-dependent protease with chaperone function
VGIVAILAARRWLQCAGSGTSVAWLLGGRWVAAPTDRPEERRLLNVTEEMAIAAGVSAPAVFVLDGERGINAFAAGTRREFAAIIVTRGALDYLTRDELQGLIAHEMSHVVHGDMAVNLRMIGLVSGLRALHAVARWVTHITRRPWYAPIDSPNERDVILLLFPVSIPLGVVGLVFDLFFVRVLLLVGALGHLTARCLQVSVNRAREELADASAVQFTRYPGGLAGVLKKIGGLPRGSAIEHPLAPLLSHMFFGCPAGPGRRSEFGTHPPLVERIRKLDPSFAGRFDPPRPLVAVEGTLYRLGHAALNDPRRPEALRSCRRRAEALITRARPLKKWLDATGDPRLREELRRLEAQRRDLWVDAGQTAARCVASATALDHGAVAPGVAPVLPPETPHPSRACGSFRNRLRTLACAQVRWPVPAGCRPTILTKVVLEFLVPPFAIYLIAALLGLALTK